ncbi:hypothetical protein A4S02_09235 [Acetobacter ascendens]|uniref:Uncharacterized protein n=1 Tax=Acetobacter ascendens TaxID=481146 RepID=A0A1D8QX73_9PROT|nr:DUF6476 family protein [Acetobacter ascendens]AOW46918.1 hypothetical protein A4S02_09235 [Acetobacter ascendens]
MEEPQEYKTPKALLMAVIGMGVLIVVGVVVLAGVLIHRMSGKPTPANLPPVALSDATPSANLPTAHATLPAGEQLLSVTRVRDNVLALHVTKNGQDRILLWDVPTGQLRTGLDVNAAH